MSKTFFNIQYGEGKTALQDTKTYYKAIITKTVWY